MKKMFFIVGLSLLVATLAGAGPAFAGNVGERQIRQQDRIAAGVGSGQLTPRETARLQSEQARIRHVKKEMRSDGRLDPAERARLHRMQDRSSRHVYAMKHNHRMMPR
ncbi:MAG: hypothetical protein ABFD70_12100 [Syntrophaceae bacterium]